MKRLSLMALAIVSSNAGVAVAQVQPNAFVNAGQLSAQQFPVGHYCATSPTASICPALIAMKNPDFSQPEDLLIAAHRGYWAYPVNGIYGGGEPENSAGSVQAAAAAGYKLVEMDVMLTADNNIVSTHDYPLYRTTNYSGPPAIVSTETLASLQQLRLRRRNGEVSTQTYLSGPNLISQFKSLGLVLVLDPKEVTSLFVNSSCVAYCENQYFTAVSWLTLVKQAISFAKAQQASHLLVIKTVLTPTQLLNGVTETSPNTNVTQTVPGLSLEDFNSVLWVPELLTSNNDTPQTIADRVDAWANYASSLAYVETDFKAPGDPQITPFTRDNVSYASIIDYLRLRYGLRSGIFTEEPVIPRGVLSRWAIAKMKNSNSDRRADHLWLRSIPYAGFMVLTTDHPDTWINLKRAW